MARTKRIATVLAWSLFLVASKDVGVVQAADCPCGYLDTTTNDLWTDSILTYFNETGAQQDVVFSPLVSPYYMGQGTSGNTGNGTEDWAAAGDQVNVWEDAFGATYRSGVAYNNTDLHNGLLRMAVNPAEMKHRIVYGAEAVTRRRDILYGTFRAAMNASLGNGAGTAFQMSAKYNDSETVDVGLYMTDLYNESTLQWSFASRGNDAHPYKVPISSLMGAGSHDNASTGFYEHRFDWKPENIVWTNNNTNISASSHTVQKGGRVNIPSSPVPLSFRHWSNGDPINSQGPPHVTDHYAYVSYVRFFFNSSLPLRTADFNAQCAAAQGRAPCSVDDLTLRGSTSFAPQSLEAISPVHSRRKAPRYSLIALTASGGLLGLLLLHGIAKSILTTKGARKADLSIKANTTSGSEKDDYAANGSKEDSLPKSESPTLSTRKDSFSGPSGPSSRHASSLSSSSGNGNSRSMSYIVESQPLVSKWDPTALAQAAQAQEEADSEDDWENETTNGDDYFLADRATESNFEATAGANENDDALGRPDHAPAWLQHNDSPSSSLVNLATEGLPTHARSSFSMPSTTTQPLLSGYVTPTRPSTREDYMANGPTTGLGSARPWTGSLSSASSAGLPPSAWTADGPGRDSAMSFNGTRRISQTPALNQLHHALLMESGKDDLTDDQRSEADHGDEVDLGRDESPFGKNLPQWITDSAVPSRPSSISQDSQLSPATNFDAKAYARRPSMVSLYTLAMSQGKTTSPQMVSVWTRRDLTDDPGHNLAARVDAKAGETSKNVGDGAAEAPKKKKNVLQKINETLFVGPDAAKTTASGAARVGYLEGLRGFACFLVSFHHFMLIFWYAATTPGAPTHTNGFEVWFHRIFGALLLNQGLKIGIFFVLPARVMGTRYMLRGRLVDLADATLRRVPRLAFPTFGAVLINYFLIQVQAYQWVPRLASRTWSTWSYFNDYDSAGSFINSWIALWFTVPPQSPVLLSTYATGILWTIPVITQSSFAVLITVIISREIPNAIKRYTFFFLCILLSWYANRLDYYFIAGLVIADMDNKLKYREAAAKGIPLMPASWAKRVSGGRVSRLSIHGQVFGWILFLGGAMCQYMESLRLPGGELNEWEHGILPDFTSAEPRVWVGDTLLSYWDPRFSLFCMVIGMFLLADLCAPFATFFMLRFWGAVGRNAFSLFLLHGTIFWSWGAWLCLQLLKVGTPYWATVTIVFITSYSILAVMCELFTRTFDAWGVSVSKALWRYTSGGLGRRD